MHRFILLILSQIGSKLIRSQRNGYGTHALKIMNALTTMHVYKAFSKIQEKKAAIKAVLEQNIAKAVELGNKGMRYTRSFAQAR